MLRKSYKNYMEDYKVLQSQKQMLHEEEKKLIKEFNSKHKAGVAAIIAIDLFIVAAPFICDHIKERALSMRL